MLEQKMDLLIEQLTKMNAGLAANTEALKGHGGAAPAFTEPVQLDIEDVAPPAEPEPQAEAPAEKVTEDDLRAALMAYQKKTSRADTEAVVKQFIEDGKIVRIQSVPAERYGDLMAALAAA